MSQTITRGGPRTQIAIPAQGMIEFRDALTDLLEEFGTDDGGFKGDLPEGRYMRVDSKNFYFDIGQNNRGIYMRISEVYMYYLHKKRIPTDRLFEAVKSIFFLLYFFFSLKIVLLRKNSFQIGRWLSY